LLVELLRLLGQFVGGPRLGAGGGRGRRTRRRGHTHASLPADAATGVSARTKRHLPSAWACRTRSKDGSSSRHRPTVTTCGGPYAIFHRSRIVARSESGLRTASAITSFGGRAPGPPWTPIATKNSRRRSRTGSYTLLRRSSSFCRRSKTPGGPDGAPATA